MCEIAEISRYRRKQKTKRNKLRDGILFFCTFLMKIFSVKFYALIILLQNYQYSFRLKYQQMYGVEAFPRTLSYNLLS